MRRISIRELRQNASAWLREVQKGEAFDVTDRGRPVARLTPLPSGDQIQQLMASGLLSLAEGTIAELPDPVPPAPGEPLPSEELEALRAEER